MIDHIGLEVRDYLRSKDFYLVAPRRSGSS